MPLDLDTPTDPASTRLADAILASKNCRPGGLRPLFGDTLAPTTVTRTPVGSWLRRRASLLRLTFDLVRF